MRGYPRHVNTKTDYLNLLNIPEFAERALEDLKRIAELDDEEMEIAVEPIDAKNPEGEWKIKTVKAQMPLWKQKGFKNRAEVLSLLAKGKKVKGNAQVSIRT